jgi:hypothetical protein
VIASEVGPAPVGPSVLPPAMARHLRRRLGGSESTTRHRARTAPSACATRLPRMAPGNKALPPHSGSDQENKALPPHSGSALEKKALKQRSDSALQNKALKQRSDSALQNKALKQRSGSALEKVVER